MPKVGVHTAINKNGEIFKVEHKREIGIGMVENDLMRDKNNLIVVYQQYPCKYTEPQYKKVKEADRLKQLIKTTNTPERVRKVIVGALESGRAI